MKPIGWICKQCGAEVAENLYDHRCTLGAVPQITLIRVVFDEGSLSLQMSQDHGITWHETPFRYDARNDAS